MRKRFVLAVICCLLGAAGSAHAQWAVSQEIPLSRGWNLVSLQVEPGDTAIGQVLAEQLSRGTIKSVWSYDASCQCWSGFVVGSNDFVNQRSTNVLTALRALRGYWIETSAAELIEVNGTLPDPQIPLLAGWNLVGFPGLFAKHLELDIQSVFRDLLTEGDETLEQVWRYNTSTDRFQGWDRTAAEPLVTFSDLEAGNGYWVYVNRDTMLAPYFQPLPAPDMDHRPYGNFPGPEDVDSNGDGYLDYMYTQDAVTFIHGQDSMEVPLWNPFNGAIDYQVVGSPQWLILSKRTGALTTAYDSFKIRIDRHGLTTGSYQYTFNIHTNTGTVPYTVNMVVPPIDADYKGFARGNIVNGRRVVLPRLDMQISLMTSAISGTLRGKIKSANSLMFAQDVPLNGRFFAGNKFILFGAQQLPAGTTYTLSGNNIVAGNTTSPNPFPFAITREFGFVGEREDWNKISGTYYERITGASPRPIQIEGDFMFLIDDKATVPDPRTGQFVPTIREAQAFGKPSAAIPDGTGSVVSGYTVNQYIRIEEVDVAVRITHPRMADLVITLTSPPPG